MLKIKVLSPVIVSCFLLAGSASAQEAAPAQPAAASPSLDNGWDTQYGVLFSLHNIFMNNAVLTGYQSYGIGGQYNLSPTTAVRIGFDLSRTTDPAVKTTNEVTAGGTTVKTETMSHPTTPTSTFGLGLGGDFLMALSTSALAPYVGGGMTLSYASQAISYEDDVSVPDTKTVVDNSDSSFGMGLRGILGIGWRIHKSFSLYAEYNLGFNVIEHGASTDDTTTTVAGVKTETKTSSSQNKVFGIGTSLAQGGALGLIAFF